MLQQMAETWDTLAEDGELEIERRKRIDQLETNGNGK